MKVLLTNDDGIQATGLNHMRRALLEVPDIELAVIAPDSNRSATARSITTAAAAVGRGDRLRRRHDRFRHRRHAGGLRALRGARPGRVPARADHLGHQPRREPRRRHHLLGHRRGRARGRRAGHPGDRRLPAVAQGRDGLPRSATGSTSSGRRRSSRGWWTSWTTSRSPKGTLLNVNCPHGDAQGREGLQRSASGSTATSSTSPRRRASRAPLPDLRRRSELPPRGRHRLRRDRRRLHRRDAAALRPHPPARDRGARRLRPRPAAPAGRAEEV